MFALLERRITHGRAVLLLAAAALLLSSGGLLIKSVNWHPMAIAGARGAVAAAVLLASMDRRPRFTGSFEQIFGALAFAVTMVLFVIATKLTTAANAILLQYTAPVYVAVLGYWFLREKSTLVDWGVTATVMGGMVLFFLDKLETGNLWGNILAVISSFTFAAFIICMRRQKGGSPVETVIIGCAITTLIGLPFMFGPSPGATGWLLLVISGIFQLGLSFVLYSTAIRHVAALEAALITCLEPLLNPVWVFLFVGEAPGRWSLAGGLVVLSAVTLHNVARVIPRTGKDGPDTPDSQRRPG